MPKRFKQGTQVSDLTVLRDLIALGTVDGLRGAKSKLVRKTLSSKNRNTSA